MQRRFAVFVTVDDHNEDPEAIGNMIATAIDGTSLDEDRDLEVECVLSAEDFGT